MLQRKYLVSKKIFLEQAASIARYLAKFLLSHSGLCLVIFLYCVGGAYLFQWIELEGETHEKMEAVRVSIKMETLKQNLLDLIGLERCISNDTIAAWWTNFSTELSDAVGNHEYAGSIIDEHSLTYGWGFASALLFTVSIVTTIGYGHIAPSTDLGKIVMIIYSLVGLPLMLMFLADIGDLLAVGFRAAYYRGCCLVCWRKRNARYKTAAEEAKRIADAEEADLVPDTSKKVIKVYDYSTAYYQNAMQMWKATLRAAAEQGRLTRTRVDSVHQSMPTEPKKRWKYLATLARAKNRNSVVTPAPDDPQIKPEQVIKDRDFTVLNVPASLTVAFIVIYLVLGAVMFSFWEGWTILEGAYFCFVTLSTIGFGDYYPSWSDLTSVSNQMKLLMSSLYIVLGLSVLSMSLNLMMEEIISKIKRLAKAIGIGKKNSGDQVVTEEDLDEISTAA